MPTNLIAHPVTAPHAQRRAAARVTIDAREQDAGDAEAGGEALGDTYRVLAGERIGDEQDLGRADGIAHRRRLGHRRLVDVEPPGRIEHHDIEPLQAPGLHGAARDVDGHLAGDDRQGGDIGLLAEDAELLLGRRPVDVERGEQHLLLVVGLEPERDLGRARGLARALQPDHQDRHRRRRLEVELGGVRPK